MLDVEDSVPEIRASITISRDRTLVILLHRKEVPASHVRDLLTGSGAVETMSQLVNVMARVKTWTEQQQYQQQSVLANLSLEAAIKSLQEFLLTLDSDSETHRKLSFTIEQLKLVTKSKYRRHYSPELTIFSYIIHAASPSAYDTLLQQNVLCLPSLNTLNKVSRRLNQNTGLTTRPT